MNNSHTIGISFPQYVRCRDGIGGVLGVYQVTAGDPADFHEVVQSVLRQDFGHV